MKNFNKLLAVGALVSASLPGSALATTINLTSIPGSGTINGAIFNAIDPQSTGTGVLDPFLREQASGNGTSERGINSSTYLVDDTKASPHTHDLPFSNLQITTVVGIDYYRLVLDANQIGNAPISLTALTLWTGPLPNSANNLDNHVGLTQRYTLGSGNEVQIQSQNGSGSGDMEMLVPIGNFAGVLNSDYFFLDATFASPPGSFGPNDGFEEWAANVGPNTTPPPPVPDTGATLVLLGMSLMGVEGLRRKLRP